MSKKFAGLEKEFSSYNSSSIVILPVHFDKTASYQRGTRNGPTAIIEASQYLERFDIESKQEVYRHGIYTAPPIRKRDSKAMLSVLYKEVSHYLREGKFVVTLGGEHSISPAPVHAHVDVHGELSVLQLDAHTDLRSIYQGTPHSHGCAMARIKEIKGVTGLTAVGIRSTSLEEQSFIDPARTIYAYETYDNDKWMDRAIATLSDRVYITLDIDVLDPSLMPSTGTPEPGGLFWPETTRFLKKVIEQRDVVGFDIVELMPIPGLKAPDFLAAKLCYEMLTYIFNNKR